MQRFFIFLLLVCSALVSGNSFAVSTSYDDNGGVNAYNNIYKSYTKTNESAGTRKVVSRNSAASARSATNPSVTTNSATRNVVSRSAAGVANNNNSRNSYQSRRVVARSARGDYSYTNDITTTTNSTSNTTVKADRCLSDYIECMNSYCEREKTDYNRCYCSSKLSQIDAKYQDDINTLILQIIDLKYTGNYTEDEMSDYWQEKIGQYTGDNSWDDLDEALNIDWSDTESRVQGQETFLTAHAYCSQHISACSYMATNMRDVYISEIASDCKLYETNLKAIKTVAESVIENYEADNE